MTQRENFICLSGQIVGNFYKRFFSYFMYQTNVNIIDLERRYLQRNDVALPKLLRLILIYVSSYELCLVYIQRKKYVSSVFYCPSDYKF